MYMKTTLEIDEALLNKAKAILGTPTIRETVEKSLQAVLRQKALNELAELGGKIEMISVEALRKRRRARLPRELR
jgi:Arc/MetJ family transcription regulator